MAGQGWAYVDNELNRMERHPAQIVKHGFQSRREVGDSMIRFTAAHDCTVPSNTWRFWNIFLKDIYMPLRTLHYITPHCTALQHKTKTLLLYRTAIPCTAIFSLMDNQDVRHLEQKTQSCYRTYIDRFPPAFNSKERNNNNKLSRFFAVMCDLR